MNLAAASETWKKLAIVINFPSESPTLFDFVNWSQIFCEGLQMAT